MFKKLLGNLYIVAIISLIAYFTYVVVLEIFGSLSVTGMNITLSIITVFVGLPLSIASAMANDSGKGGFVINTFQFLGLTYFLVYLIGLISSISVLYSDIENKEELAFWLASMPGIHLLIIIAFFASIYLKESFDQYW